MSPLREPVPRSGAPAAAGEIHVWRGADRHWRYRYVDAGKGAVITGNRSSLTRGEAVESARTAYPGVPVVELRVPPEGGRRRGSRWRQAAMKLFGVGVSALVLRRIFRLVRGLRRSARRARAVATWVGFAVSLARKDPSSSDHRSR
jgi:hypothetical protein